MADEEDVWTKEAVVEMILKEPDRVKFASFSKKRPHFRKILVDNKSTLFVKCLKCSDHICKYNSKMGSGILISHEKRVHGDEDLDVEDWEEDLLPRQEKEDTASFSKVKDSFNYPYMVWDHCTLTGDKTASGLEVRACMYCGKVVGASPAYATIHMKECSNVPEEIKKGFVHRQKRKWMDEMSDDSDLGADDGDEQEKVVKILTGLLTKTRDSGKSDSGKKPLNRFTDSDFDRELKELAVKKARLEIKELEDRQREMDERIRMYKDIRKALSLWMDKESNSILIPPRVKDMLQEAYEDSITSQSVNGQHAS